MNKFFLLSSFLLGFNIFVNSSSDPMALYNGSVSEIELLELQRDDLERTGGDQFQLEQLNHAILAVKAQVDYYGDLVVTKK